MCVSLVILFSDVFDEKRLTLMTNHSSTNCTNLLEQITVCKRAVIRSIVRFRTHDRTYVIHLYVASGPVPTHDKYNLL